MRTVCKKDELLTLLELASHVVAKNHTLPVLQCILLKTVGEGSLEVRATNLEVSIVGKLGVKIETQGIVAVPASLLVQTISLLTHPEVTLSLQGDVLIVESAHSKTKIKTLSPDEFPTINDLVGVSQVVDAQLLSLGIKTASFAVSQSAIKPELSCVSVHQKQPHTLTFVATDSFRLVEKTLSFQSFTLAHTLLIPHKNALEIARTLDVLRENPQVTYTESQIMLTFPKGVSIISRLVEGSFPDYEQIIPKEYQTHAQVLVSDFAHALKKTNIFTNKFLQVNLSVKTDVGTVVLTSENADAGTTEETIRATIDGVAIALNFNQQYLFDPIAHIAEDSINLSFAGIGRPLVLSGLHDKNFRYLVMPMNK